MRQDNSNPDLQPSGEAQDTEAEVMPQDTLVALQRAEIDMGVATARKYGRSIKQFMTDAQSMISLDTDTAEACNYKLKRRNKDGSQKIIEGPSIRLMEIVASAYQHVRYGSRILSTEGSFVTTQGVASDMMRNVHCSVETKRRITGSDGRRYSEDMIGVTANAAGSIARRNALKGIIPVAYVNQLADFAKQIAIGDIKSLPERRQRAVEYFTKTLGVDISRVLAYCEKKSMEDLDLADVEDLQGLKTALKEGDVKLEEAFADTSANVTTPKTAAEAPKTYPAGQGKPETPKPQEPPAAAKPPLDVLKANMASDKVTEVQLLEHLRKINAIDESLSSLQEISMVSPSVIENSITGWTVIAKTISVMERQKTEANKQPKGK